MDFCCPLLRTVYHTPDVKDDSSLSSFFLLCSDVSTPFLRIVGLLPGRHTTSPNSSSALETFILGLRFEKPSSSVLVLGLVQCSLAVSGSSCDRILGLLLSRGSGRGQTLRLHDLVGDQVLWISLENKVLE